MTVLAWLSDRLLFHFEITKHPSYAIFLISLEEKPEICREPSLRYLIDILLINQENQATRIKAWISLRNRIAHSYGITWQDSEKISITDTLNVEFDKECQPLLTADICHNLLEECETIIFDIINKKYGD